MLSELCAELKNWFEVKKIFGDFTVKDGSITIEGVKNGQYVRICGSTFNDGVYKYQIKDLHDESWNGSIWVLNVPADVIDLSDEIDKWKEKNSKVVESPYQSESFGGYSYTLKSGSGSDGSVSWEDVFSRRLKRWRKL